MYNIIMKKTKLQQKTYSAKPIYKNKGNKCKQLLTY